MKTMLVPARMSHRPRDRRGLPIPFIVVINDDGTPLFSETSAERVERCLRERLCAACGDPMGADVYFIGIPEDVVGNRFAEPPMHRECAEFATRACPHLARSKAEPAYCLILHASDYCFEPPSPPYPPRELIIHAKLPWLDVVHYRDSEVIEGGTT